MQASNEGRDSARHAIEERIARLRSRADCLEVLLGALPAKLPLAADRALWQLVIDSRQYL